MIATLLHRTGELIQDRYRVDELLGSGAFGTVYRCRDRELNTWVAVKELHVLDAPNIPDDLRERALAQFRAEATHLAHLRHPNIVSGHYQPHQGIWQVCPVCGHSFDEANTCPDDGATLIELRQRHYLVMEHLDGPDLAAAAEQAGGTLPVPDALRYIGNVGEALRLIHDRGWVHRDVKPENVRIRTTGDDAVLLDFGIATASGAAGDFSTRRHRHTTGGGTLGYAPESSQERLHPDARSDIYALGMTLYRLVSGRDPQEPQELFEMRRHPPRAHNPAIGIELEELILRSIDPDPRRRPHDAARFLDDLQSASAPPGPCVVASKPEDPVPPPLTFRSGGQATNLAELVALIDRHPREGRTYLYSGDLANWLAQIGRVDLAERAREVVLGFARNQSQGLEALLQYTGLLPAPSLEVTPTRLDFGTIAPGTRKTMTIELRNPGRGHLFGELRSAEPYVDFAGDFDGNLTTVAITINGRRLPRGSHSGEVVVDSSAREVRLPFAVAVRGNPGLSAGLTVVLWSTLGMLCGQMLRALPLIHQHHPPGWAWLTYESDFKWDPASPLFGACVLGVLCLLMAGEATRRRSWNMVQSAAFPILLLGLLCAWAGRQMLIAGDLALRPFMQPIVHHWAAGAWMYVGGVLGAAYGTMRRIRDVFSARLPHIVGGWLAAMFILYSVLGIAFLLVKAYG